MVDVGTAEIKVLLNGAICLSFLLTCAGRLIKSGNLRCKGGRLEQRAGGGWKEPSWPQTRSN